MDYILRIFKNVFIKLEKALNSQSSIGITSQYSLENQGFGGKLQGSPSLPNFVPSTVSAMSSQQYAWLNADSTMRNRMNSYTMDSTTQSSLTEDQINLASRRNAAMVEREQTSSNSFSRYSPKYQFLSDEIEHLNTLYSENEKKLNANSEALRKNSLVIETFTMATNAAKQFSESLQNVKASFYAAQMGLTGIQEKIDNIPEDVLNNL